MNLIVFDTHYVFPRFCPPMDIRQHIGEQRGAKNSMIHPVSVRIAVRSAITDKTLKRGKERKRETEKRYENVYTLYSAPTASC